MITFLLSMIAILLLYIANSLSTIKKILKNSPVIKHKEWGTQEKKETNKVDEKYAFKMPNF